jgi:hypothetical protein
MGLIKSDPVLHSISKFFEASRSKVNKILPAQFKYHVQMTPFMLH